MTFDAFKAEYLETFNRMMSYSPDQVGSQVYAEKMATLSGAHPDWVEQIEEAA